jgi:acyl-CoA dehydrogenase
MATLLGISEEQKHKSPYQVVPISTNLILAYVAEHVLGLPRSF